MASVSSVVNIYTAHFYHHRSFCHSVHFLKDRKHYYIDIDRRNPPLIRLLTNYHQHDMKLEAAIAWI